MRPASSSVVLLQFSVFLIAVGYIRGQNGQTQNSKKPQHPPGNGNNKQPPYNTFGSYDYSQGSDYSSYEIPQEEYQCYSCTFHVRQGTAAGQDNCRDPFVKSGINMMPCKGPCAKIYHKTSETEYTITRICLPNCKDIRDEKGYTQCCYGHLCNGSSSRRIASNFLLLTSCAAVTWFTFYSFR